MSYHDRLAIYTHLRTYESDFDKAQSQLRTIASAWSAAALAAIALITINSIAPIVVPQGATVYPDLGLSQRATIFLYLRQLICVIGSVGIFAFWFVDQRVYQKLLHSVFAYGLYLEFKNPDLPQIRSAAFASNLDVTRWLGWFYRVQFWAFVLLSLFFLVVSWPITVEGTVIFLSHFLIIGIVGELIAESWPSLKQIVGDLYGELNDAWPDLNNQNDNRTKAWLARVKANPAKP
jgi:hypothetical protein